MKTPAFWFESPGLLSTLLLPAAFLYRIGARLRRVFASPYRAKIPVVCIGNLVAGGAGKTPAALAIAALLKETGKQPVFVTRGYGGKERGPLQIDPARHTSRDVGDEALLLARVAPVYAGRDRAAAIRLAESHGTHIILDDGLQNPNVLPDLAFLVVDGTAGFGNGYLIPAGPLRETFAEAIKRVTAIILIADKAEQKIILPVRCPILRAQLRPDLPADFSRTQRFFAFAGIARPEKFYASCRQAGLNVTGTEDFSDHHNFSTDELSKLQDKAAAQKAVLLTTEKDWVRLPDDMRKKTRVFPVKLVFDDEGSIKRLLKI